MYIATLGFGSVGPPAPEAAIWHKQIPNGFRWTFGYWTPEDAEPVPWSQVEIQLTDGRHNAIWEDISAQDLDTGALVTKSYESVIFGDMTVFLNITDMEGDGIAEYKDNFEITTSGGAFSSDDVYLLFVIWKPINGWISTDFIVWGY